MLQFHFIVRSVFGVVLLTVFFSSFFSGYLGCWPNSAFSDIRLTFSESDASYDVCKAHCGANDTVVTIAYVSKSSLEQLVYCYM